ncbi:MAG: membrane zinc metalloprotease [Melioribacteraceae bacterium]|nr:MAG: membrane zinc metalloprotease [Melioribacteraceae bacterium]
MKANNRKLLELFILLSLVVLSFFLWNTIVIYPIKLLVVLLHEISHGIAAFVTGGVIIEIEINEFLGGHCISQGGNEFVVASSGYLGSLFWGASLFIAAYNKKWSVWFQTFLGAFMIFITANYISNIYAAVISILFAIYFILAPRILPDIVNRYASIFLGITSALYAAVDIGQDIILNTYVGSDAYFLSVLTGVPAIIWGALWMMISLFVIYRLFIFAYNKGNIKL